MASLRQESTKTTDHQRNILTTPQLLADAQQFTKKKVCCLESDWLDVVKCPAWQRRAEKERQKRKANWERAGNARDIDKKGKAASPCSGGQRFTAGLLIKQPTDQLNTMDAANTPIRCDIMSSWIWCVGPMFFHCCPGSVMFQEVNSGQSGVRAPTHAECLGKWLTNSSQWKCTRW